MTIDTDDLIKALEERKRQLSKWTDKDRAKERIDEIDCIIDTDVPYLVKEESEKHVTDDLEEAAHSYSESDEPLYSPGHRFHWDSDSLFGKQIETTFIAGAKWQYQKDREKFAQIKAKTWSEGFDACKEQMLKEAVEGEAHPDDCEIWVNLIGYGCDIKDGDKVRVIILPKED